MTLPEKPTLAGLEAKWDAEWSRSGVYRFDRSRTRSEIYSVDTPPPTVSGSLHLGSAFGYIQTDALVRFHRMLGEEVYYPMGWDDNGLPTERRVQNYYGVLCDPSLPYDSAFTPSEGGKDRQRISRQNFIELCNRLTQEDEKVFERVWRMLGLSVDWTLTYATIADRARRVSQAAFLHNLERGEAYTAEAPTVWDVDFQTAVAQAEIEDRETPGAYYAMRFRAVAGGEIRVESTRPELLPACVALVVHPEDERHRGLVGKEALSPVFGVRLPIVAHPAADPEKGSGIAMICTFGDTTDVVWWRELRLPLRVVLGRDGRFQPAPPEWLEGEAAERYEALAGKRPEPARAAIADLLRQADALLEEPRPIVHPVKYFEKGDRPLEIVTSRQWYIRNGANDPELRDELRALGAELAWHPEYMEVRYEHWVAGLNTDWLISRQRYFGVPFPVWYRLDAEGRPDYEHPLTPELAALPVDPQIDVPPGHDEGQRNRPGGFTADPDVMDTWATSSLTPQIVCGWLEDDDLFERTFPMDLRPQGPEIIRTWLFSSVLRSRLEHGELPWSNASINGWIVDPDRKKMSKSRGNVITPEALVEEHGADGVRYWACRAAPGADTILDVAVMRNGRRLAIKVLNASRFVLGVAPDASPRPAELQPVDRALLGRLAAAVDEATTAFAGYAYNQALAAAESFFWEFCDDYIELVKDRAYGDGPGADSARWALRAALETSLRLLAPFLPFATEEVWSWWREGSVHRSGWPRAEELRPGPGSMDGAVLQVAADVLNAVRRAKTAARQSLRAPVERVVLLGGAERLAAARAVEADLRQAGHIEELILREAEPAGVEVELGAPAGDGAPA